MHRSRGEFVGGEKRRRRDALSYVAEQVVDGVSEAMCFWGERGGVRQCQHLTRAPSPRVRGLGNGAERRAAAQMAGSSSRCSCGR